MTKAFLIEAVTKFSIKHIMLIQAKFLEHKIKNQCEYTIGTLKEKVVEEKLLFYTSKTDITYFYLIFNKDDEFEAAKDILLSKNDLNFQKTAGFRVKMVENYTETD